MNKLLIAIAAVLLPVIGQASVFAVYDTGRTTFALSTAATGSCTGQWRDAHVITYGNTPSCWARTGTRVSICPAPKGQKFVARGCLLLSSDLFTDVASLPRQANFPK